MIVIPSDCVARIGRSNRSNLPYNDWFSLEKGTLMRYSVLLRQILKNYTRVVRAAFTRFNHNISAFVLFRRNLLQVVAFNDCNEKKN